MGTPQSYDDITDFNCQISLENTPSPKSFAPEGLHVYSGATGLMSFDVPFSILSKRIGTPKAMMTLPILIVKFH